MKAFISYSHHDTHMLDLLHKHLAHLQRDGSIQAWVDQKIPAGGEFEKHISNSLETSQIFLALLSPDYLASSYCYEKEFEKAVELQEKDKLIIVPVILEPCDWMNTPFNKFKALPKDGKPISTWENKNTAFLDVIQNLRNLVTASVEPSANKQTSQASFSRNYRVQKDFDSIEKLEFLEKTFQEVKDFIKRYVDEIIQLDNIKVRILVENDNTFKALLVNRNKIATEAELNITTQAEGQNMRGFYQGDDKLIHYSISGKNNPQQKSFKLSFNEYQLFWTEANFYAGRTGNQKFSSKDISENIWNEWLNGVGIL